MVMQQGQNPPYADTAAIDEEAIAEVETRERRQWLPTWVVILWENRKSRVGMILLAIFILIAIFAPVIAPYDPRYNDLPPNLDPSRDHLLGTTTRGEDIFSQLVYGARTSLIVGLGGGILATLIAMVIGLSAGYLLGIVDEILSFLINLALVIPVLPLIALLAAYSPASGIGVIIFIIGITSWAHGARMKRSQIITLRTRDYITAAVFAGESIWRIIFREVLPNMISLTVVGFFGAAAGAIGAEAGLAFLGLGDPDTVSWGTMTYWADNQGALVTGQWAWLLSPGLALTLLMIALTLLNFGIDALSNPQLREE